MPTLTAPSASAVPSFHSTRPVPANAVRALPCHWLVFVFASHSSTVLSSHGRQVYLGGRRHDLRASVRRVHQGAWRWRQFTCGFVPVRQQSQAAGAAACLPRYCIPRAEHYPILCVLYTDVLTAPIGRLLFLHFAPFRTRAIVQSTTMSHCELSLLILQLLLACLPEPRRALVWVCRWLSWGLLALPVSFVGGVAKSAPPLGELAVFDCLGVANVSRCVLWWRVCEEILSTVRS